MKKNLKRTIGNLVIHLGKHAVGKCMIPGMYDPKIPEALKENKYIMEVGAEGKKHVNG